MIALALSEIARYARVSGTVTIGGSPGYWTPDGTTPGRNHSGDEGLDRPRSFWGGLLTAGVSLETTFISGDGGPPRKGHMSSA